MGAKETMATMLNLMRKKKKKKMQPKKANNISLRPVQIKVDKCFLARMTHISYESVTV